MQCSLHRTPEQSTKARAAQATPSKNIKFATKKNSMRVPRPSSPTPEYYIIFSLVKTRNANIIVFLLPEDYIIVFWLV